ncbi:MAG: UbiD family decarboxylase [Fibrobacter sp.]|nr:UbiD family decarboxylase [Fibrobacter sp.]
MGYKSLHAAVLDLERHGQLMRVQEPLDPYLEIPAIQRRLYQIGAPAVLFENPKGTQFPVLANLYGNLERTRWLFRKNLPMVEWLMKVGGDPLEVFHTLKKWPRIPGFLWSALPKRVFSGPVFAHETQISKLPLIHSWPEDGGAFITLPQVLSMDVNRPSIMSSNLGMYRIQMNGNDFELDKECGMHYQIHRGIGIHHHAAIQKGENLKVSIFVGGPPSHSIAAIMPMPEGLPELAFAGMIGRRGFRYAMHQGWVVSTEADFCILGEIAPDLKPEGPFGDHFGYYSLKHDFPYIKIHKILHRKNAIWPFTVVGRPPQEDTSFGDFIHEITGAMVPASVPGVKEINAVDAAGVHSLLLAIGSERYVPYELRRPMEILTQANALLGFNQVSLAKYLFITAQEDNPQLKTRNIVEYFSHVLERVNFQRDLHFQTQTTIDTLDYSGDGLNRGSKLVVAVAGPAIRSLGKSRDEFKDIPLDDGFSNPQMIMPGMLAIQGPPWESSASAAAELQQLAEILAHWEQRDKWPWITICDDSDFCAQSVDNWLWASFIKSNPAADVWGVKASTYQKHWGCEGPLLVDARTKSHHAPPLLEDPKIAAKVDEMFASKGIFGHLSE